MGSLSLTIEDPNRALGLAEGLAGVALQAVGAGQQQARFAFERAISLPVVVLQKLERGSDRRDGVLRAEGVECLQCRKEPVFDCLFCNVTLRLMVQKPRVHPIQSFGVTRLECLGDTPVKRTAPAA